MKRDQKALPRSGTPGRILLMGAWFGLVVGLVEVCVLATQKILFDKIIHLSRDFPWMTPLADLLLFSVLGAVLALAAGLWPRRVSPTAGAFLFGFVGFLGVLLFYPKLHVLALLLLAAGLAAQIARLIARHPRDFERLVRRTTPLLAGLVLLLGVGLRVGLWLDERLTLAQLPSAARGAPNVLLLVLDTARAQSMSLYGYGRSTTPELVRFARSGVRFEHALSTAPWTLPAHATLFTGRWPHELSTSWETRLDDTHPTLAEILSAHGYRTAGFVANAGWAGYEHGLSRGFARYEDYQVTLTQVLASTFLLRLGRLVEREAAQLDRPAQEEQPTRKNEPASPRPRVAPAKGLKLMRPLLNRYGPLRKKTAPKIHDRLLDWLDEDRERPFFAFLNYMETHDPYTALPPFDTLFGPTRPEHRTTLEASPSRQPSPEKRYELLVNAYDGALGTLDRDLGRLFDELRARKLLENTLVVVTSDHGEQLGEHGLLFHANSLYIQLLHVPLLISLPGRVPAGRSVAGFVTLRDVPATILDLAGIESDGVAIPGTSLARFWEAGGAHGSGAAAPLLSEVNRGLRTPPQWPVTLGDMKSLVIDPLHYIRNGNRTEELYDLESDPFEERNLVSRPEGQAALPRFRSELQAFLARAGARPGASATDEARTANSP